MVNFDGSTPNLALVSEKRNEAKNQNKITHILLLDILRWIGINSKFSTISCQLIRKSKAKQDFETMNSSQVLSMTLK